MTEHIQVLVTWTQNGERLFYNGKVAEAQAEGLTVGVTLSFQQELTDNTFFHFVIWPLLNPHTYGKVEGCCNPSFAV